MTADTDPRCPLCGAMLQPIVEHYCKIDSDSIDAPIVVAVCERLPAAGWLPPADAARLRALLRELVEAAERVQPLATGDSGHEAWYGLDVTLARARAEVGDDE